ncbi:MAG: autotransporter strand-loop-strand O-heptosyltransferase [Selenomonadaceae bacterium]|nr:autotransporter strand-loop-strand O-heptosyltransferase [Selenomonadaceae bacterium]
MKKLFFCAKNLADYLTPLHKLAGRDIVDVNSKGLLETDDVQNLFRSVMKSHFTDDKYFDTPISEEIVTGIEGVKLDFNIGLRLEVPAGNWRIKISDADSGMVYYNKNISDTRLNSLETYYINWHVKIFRDDKKVFEYTLNLKDKPVLMFIPKIGMGDVLSMLPYLEEFSQQHNCKLSVVLPEYLREFTEHLYPKFIFEEEISYKHLATYPLTMPSNMLPIWYVDIRNYPLSRIAGVALGLNYIAPKPKFEPTKPPLIDNPYVCIAVQASNPKKTWLYPNGWDIVVDYLKSLGYRVLCIDRHLEVWDDEIKTAKPDGAEDLTGNFSIMDRANTIYYAEFFVGLGSGLAWVADIVNCPVVLICGFSQDWCEFYTPYRVANRIVCNGCFNNINVNYMNEKCPFHEGTEREFECQKKISPRQVINAIERLIINEHLLPPVLSI